MAGPAADGVTYGADEFGEGRPLRTHCVGDAVVRLDRLGQAEARQVVDVDAADPVVPPASDGEDGQPAQQPGDVVEQHAVATEQNGRPQDRVRDIALGQRPLHHGLAPEVG